MLRNPNLIVEDLTLRAGPSSLHRLPNSEWRSTLPDTPLPQPVNLSPTPKLQTLRVAGVGFRVNPVASAQKP